MGWVFTLGVHEVRHWHDVRLIGMHGSVLEHLVDMALGSDAHVFLSEMLDMSIDVGASKLLLQRNLLERHAMDASRGGTKQRSCSEERALHDCA